MDVAITPPGLPARWVNSLKKPDFSAASPILLLQPFKKNLRLWWRRKPRAGWYAVTGFYLCIW
jgi:hypothetical protein